MFVILANTCILTRNLDKVADVHEYIRWLFESRVQTGRDTSNPPRSFQKLNGVWGKWNSSQILSNDSVFDGIAS